MIINNSLTLYHKGVNKTTKLETWTRYNYEKVWFFGGKGAGLRKGYQDANDVEIRIPYELNDNLDFRNFAIGDIIVQGLLDTDIAKETELNNHQIYKITSINDNKFGINQHIHVGGK